jgi:flotillin
MLSVLGVVALVATLLTIWIISLRRVVNTNEVHIVQSSRETVSYGKDQGAGNTYNLDYFA